MPTFNFGFGGGGPVKAGITSATGTASSFVASGITYNLWTYTASGTFTVASAGLVDMLLLAGGGGGNGQNGGPTAAGDGGAGGLLQRYYIWLDLGDYSVTVGGGGGAGSQGGDTYLTNTTTSRQVDLAWGGGGGGYSYTYSSDAQTLWRGFPGGSGGGAGGSGPPGQGVTNQGTNGSGYSGGGAGGVNTPLTVSNWASDGAGNARTLSLGPAGGRRFSTSPSNVGAGGSSNTGSGAGYPGEPASLS
jgi:hypothetical protein